MRIKLCVAMALGLVFMGTPIWAHHAFEAEFDQNKPVTLVGKVTGMEWINPHSWIHIDVKGEDGTVANWMIEGGSPNNLYRLGFTKDSLPPGTEIVVEGYQAKDKSTRAVGKNITFTDGRRLFLGLSALESEPDKK